MPVADPLPALTGAVGVDASTERTRLAERVPWLAPVSVGVATLAATAYTWRVDPNTSARFPICPLRALTGVDCPMCGSLRAVHSLTHFDLLGAIDHNIVLVVALPFVVYAFVAWLAASLGLNVRQPRISNRFALIGGALLLLYGVVRNLPIPGHDLLNSTAMMAGRSG